MDHPWWHIFFMDISQTYEETTVDRAGSETRVIRDETTYHCKMCCKSVKIDHTKEEL